MEIKDGLVVTIEFTLKDGAGTLVESSESLTFKMGTDKMLPGLAKAMMGMTVGEVRKGTIAPGKLVPPDPAHRRDVLFTEFPGGAVPEVGARFQAKGPDGSALIFEVIEKGSKSVKVQVLHGLHDTEVHYEVKVLAARRASLPPPPPVDVPDLTDDLLGDD